MEAIKTLWGKSISTAASFFEVYESCAAAFEAYLPALEAKHSLEENYIPLLEEQERCWQNIEEQLYSLWSREYKDLDSKALRVFREGGATVWRVCLACYRRFPLLFAKVDSYALGREEKDFLIITTALCFSEARPIENFAKQEHYFSALGTDRRELGLKHSIEDCYNSLRVEPVKAAFAREAKKFYRLFTGETAEIVFTENFINAVRSDYNSLCNIWSREA